jgi:four helix bundle protein
MSLPHHKLVAWQRADDLFIEIHQLTRKTFPPEEKYELSSQLRRAAYSVPANIVEGNARQYTKERFHFLSVASASLAEVGYGLHAAHRLGYLLPARYAELEKKVRQVAAPLNGLMDRYRGKNGLVVRVASKACLTRRAVTRRSAIVRRRKPRARRRS